MKFKLILFSFFFTVLGFGQSAADAESLFAKKQFSKASKAYEQLLKRKPNDATLNFRLGICYLELKDAENAIKYFQKTPTKYAQRDFYLGNALFAAYRFDESLTTYQSYLASLKPNDNAIVEVNKAIQKAEKAARLISKTEDIGIIDSVLVNKSEFLNFYKFYSELGSLKQQQIKLNSRKTADKIIYTTQRKDRVYKSDTIGGQLDLFTSYKLLDEWSKPSSLPANINSVANENYPFLLLDGITLYFASDGENSIGGYDLFITRYSPATDTYLAPENIGFPFNSTSNDYMMVIDEHSKLGWFATDRGQQAGKVVIYTFVPNETKQIFRTQNADSLINAAQLKLYRKVTKSLTDSTVKATKQLVITQNQMSFEVNDSTVYNNVSQFKSEDARKMWSEMTSVSSDLMKNKTLLKTLRIKYSETENAEDKDKLAKQIIELESENVETEKQYNQKIIEIRKAENKALFVN